MLKIDDINDFIAYIKPLKPDMVFIYNGRVFSIDNNITCIKSLENLYYKPIVQILEKKLFSYNRLVALSKILETYTENIDITDNYIFNELECPIIRGMNNAIENSIERCIHIMNAPQTEIYNDIHLDKDFLYCANTKSSDGTRMCKIGNKYIISLFSGILHINKNDKVNVHIFDLGSSFIATFYVKKAKNVVVTTSLRIGKV